MRAVAAATDAQAAVSVEGTITVLLAGAASGAAAGAIYHALAALLPQRTWLRDAGFVLLLCALTLRGLNPVQALPLALFGPVMAVFAVAYVSAWRRFTSRPVVVEPAV